MSENVVRADFGDEEEDRPRRPRIVKGGTFALDAPEEIPAVWGRGQEVLWPEGETLGLVGPQGVGKTTQAQQIVLARTGARGDNPTVLGLPVKPSDKPTLYIAGDRPPQIARSLKRMVTESDRKLLDERLIVHRGPPPFSAADDDHTKFATWVDNIGAGTVVIDGLKDVAIDLSKDETGSRLNRALQYALLVGIELLVLLHPRKPEKGATPREPTLEDVYGSIWITSGMGSVILLWAKPGDPCVKFVHLKQPAEEVGPFEVVHDHRLGVTTIHDESATIETLLATPGGIGVRDIASAVYGVEKPRRGEIEKVRRTVLRMCSEGVADQLPGTAFGGPKDAILYALRAKGA